jgi:hypothetical protein
MDSDPKPTPVQPIKSTLPSTVDSERQNRIRIAVVAAGVIIGIALLVLVILFLLNPGTPTARIRDVFIIFMAMISLVIGVALVILSVQVAILINLLQNEIKPILNSTNETVNTLRGTATFLSKNLAEPVIKLNEYLAAIKRLTDLLRPGGK